MEWRVISAVVLICLACIFAGFLAGTPDYDPTCKYTHSADRSALGLFSRGENYAAKNSDGSDCYPPKWYTALKKPDGMLVLVGIATCLILIWQSWATGKAAEATRDSVKVLVNSERAWILAEIGEAPPPKTDMQVVWVAPKITNYGKTPGKILRISIAVRWFKNPPGLLPDEPEYGPEQKFNYLLPPSKEIRPVKVIIPGREFQDVVERKTSLYIYRFIDYLDLGEIQRKTRFCFTYYVPPIEGDLGEPGFYIAGGMPEKYNDYS
jgi:hypothetical protein